MTKKPLQHAEIVDYIHSILTRPQMYAKTREAFIAQLTVLLEVLGYQQPDLYTRFLRRGGKVAFGLAKEITDKWMAPVVVHVRALLKEQVAA